MTAQTDPAQVVLGQPTLYLLASIGNLALAILIIFRARDGRGALPLSLLCLSLFLWDISECAFQLLESPPWRYARLVGSSVAPAFLFHFVLHFVRREQKLRRPLWLLYGLTSLFAFMTGGALFSEDLKRFVDSTIWNLIYLVVLFPFLVFSLILIARRMREVADRTERNALNVIGLGVGIGAFTGLADLTVILQGPLPPLGHFGSIAMTVTLAVAIFRHRVLEKDIPFQQINVVLIVAASAVLLNFLLYRLVKPEKGDLLILGSAVLIVVVLAVSRLLWAGWYERKEQQKRLALMGAMAAGVAHEVKNPLASIKGAAQFVQKELEGHGAAGESSEYLKMIVDESDRLNRVVENLLDYAKPLAPRRQNVRLGPLLEEVIALQRAGGGASVEFDADGAPDIEADPELLRHAVSNILRNAVEAAGEEGKVTVRIRPVEGGHGHVAIEIEDNGPGIPREKMEEVFNPFFTTKARGTGLGLAIAQRIVEGHGGEIGIAGVEPHGARFTLLLPARPV